MRTLPALRHSYAGGILRALAEQGPISLADLIESVPKQDLFKGNTENFEGRARSLLTYERGLGLVTHENGTFGLTTSGDEYVAVGDPNDPWSVSNQQAALLRDLMVQDQNDGSIFQSAALALSVLASGDGVQFTSEELGRALAAADGTAKWKERNTFISQARGYTTLLSEMGLIDADSRVTPAGSGLLEQVQVPDHPSLGELVARQDVVRGAVVWMVWAGSEGQAEGINFTESVTSIGWGELPDLGEVTTIEEAREVWHETYPADNPARVNTQARQVHLFAQDIAEGDLVLTPLRTQPGLVAVARVTGPYEYRDQSPFVPHAQHIHPVEWLSKGLPAETFAEQLRAKFGARQTVTELSVPDAARLVGEAVSGGGADALHLVVKWSAAYGPETIERHIDVAKQHGAVWWGLATSSESAESLVDQKWIDRLQEQIATGVPTKVFLSGPTCWSTSLLAVSYSRDDVEEELIPPYYGAVNRKYHLWVKLSDFEQTDRETLLRRLDPERKPSRGRLVALGNQTNPLFVRDRTTPRHWWVNQGASYVRAREGEYAWAPITDKAGNTPEHWQAMRYLRERDVVLNYANTQIRARSEVVREATPSERPDPDADQAWSNDGLRVELEYHDLDTNVGLNDIPVEWRRAEGGPFTRDGAVKQGYLFPVSDDFAAKLQRTFPQLDLLPTPGVGTLIDTVPPKGRFDLEALEAAVAARRLRIAPEILANVLAALLGGKHVILTGPPGTAKTTLAELVASVAADAGRCTGYTLTTATADWTTYETIGGLKPDPEAGLAFQEGHFLEAIRRRQWLVIDELNRSNFDRAFGQLFTVLSGQAVELPYERVKGGGRLALVPEGATHKLQSVEVLTIPAEWRVIATMNVFDKSLLFEMSFALMRRFAFIEVPSPSQDDFLSLIAEQTQGDVEASDLAASFLPVRDLKDLGPAIFMDLARFIYARKQIGDPNDGQLAFEAFYSYLLPQFEGIDEVAGERLYKLVRKLVKAPNDERLQSTLRAVLGLELATVAPSSPTIEEELDGFSEPSDLDVDEHDPR